jgi:hypothetical protein
MLREIGLRRARVFGLASVGLIVILQAINSFGCDKHDVGGYLKVLALLAIPMSPALLALFTTNPLRAVGASALFAPWLVLAYYTDCISPYEGGGASMIYVVVFMYGFATAVIGALASGPLFRVLGIRVRSEP